MNRFDQANKEEQEKRNILSMWNAAKKCSSKADNTFTGGSATPHAKGSWSDGSAPSLLQLPIPGKTYNKNEDAIGLSANVITASDDMEMDVSRGDFGKDETEDVTVKAVQPLEQDCRELQMDK